MHLIYLYPTKPTDVSLAMELHGLEFVSHYPNMSGDHWQVSAKPDGSIAAGGREHRCLSWQPLAVLPWTLDQERAFCVSGGESESFLETSLTTLGLNGTERDDCLMRWLPALERNPYNLVQFVATEYTDAAELTVLPKPDTVVRVFMLLKRSSIFVETKPAPLTPGKRGGFTVVEWGAAEMTEEA